jgi:demethylmenaquinone methyltransferase/2-methoxy-6-polyprenyl-1,4-benzoquinol methylase
MFSSIANRYDLGNTVLSMGIHHLWRKTLLDLVALEKGEYALDLCTGTGDLLPGLEKQFPKVTGADFCQPMLELAKVKNPSEKRHLVQADALNLPFADNTFDLVTVSFGVRNFADLQKGLSEIYRVLKPKGRIIVLEFGQPQVPIFSILYKWYSKNIMPLIGGAVTGNKSAYTYLPETAKNFPCSIDFENELQRAKFFPEVTKPLTFGIAFLYQARKVERKV